MSKHADIQAITTFSSHVSKRLIRAGNYEPSAVLSAAQDAADMLNAELLAEFAAQKAARDAAEIAAGFEGD